jgi:hypothetical protein
LTVALAACEDFGGRGIGRRSRIMINQGRDP